MANVNYSEIAAKNSDIKKGFIQLETILTRPPNADESASLTAAYARISQSNDFSKGNNIIEKFNKIQDYSPSVKSFTEGKNIIEPSEMIIGAEDLVKAFFSKQGDFIKGFTKLFDTLISSAMEGIADILKEQVRLFNDVNSELSISGDMSQAFRDNLRDTIEPAAKFNYELKDVSDTIIGMMKETGRLSTFSSEVMNKLPEVSRAFVRDMDVLGSYFRQYELVGYSAEQTLESIEKAGHSSLNLGLNAKKVVKETSENISRINEFGFSKGVEGLQRMVQKSVEFRMNMDSVFKIAEDVFDPDKAINLSANLQAIGGAIGDFNDPLKLMYMATNNVEGLQDALIGVTSQLATYNTEQGKFEITGQNLRKARALANELGISYKELSNSAIAAAERSSAATALLSSGLNLKPDEKEFLTNISRMKDGRMVIDVSNMSDQFKGLKEVALQDLTDNQKEILLKNQEAFKAMSTEEIAKSQYTETQKMLQNVQEIKAMLKIQFAKSANPTLRGFDNQLRAANDFLSKTMKGETELSKEFNRISSKKINDEVKESDKLKSNQKAKEDNSKKSETKNSDNKNEVTINHKVDMNWRVPMVLDATQRELIKNSEFSYDFYESLFNKRNYTSINDA